jgi:hypothetical protein
MRPACALLVPLLAVVVACSGSEAPRGNTSGSPSSQEPTRPLPSPLPEVVALLDGEPIRFAQIVPLARREIDADDEGHDERGRNRAVRRALERYIDRELLFEEARSRGIRPNQRDLDWAYDQARREHPDDEAWRTFLAESGLDPRTFKTEMRIDHTVSALLEAEAGAWPSDDEARRAYEAKPEDFVPPGPEPPPFDDVRDQVKTLLRQQQIEEVSRLLLEDLRGRARIETFL